MVTTIYVSALGKLEEFDLKKDLVSAYIEREQNLMYLGTNNSSGR